MLSIDDQTLAVQNAKEIHVQYVSCYINRKIHGNTAASRCQDANCGVCKGGIRMLKGRMSAQLRSSLERFNFKALVAGRPDELVKLNQKFRRLFNGLGSRRMGQRDVEVINGVVDYDWFQNKTNEIYNAYDLCNNLKVETCVYCNRVYTSTVINDNKERIIRPTLDHWFSQERFPLLALSFYNLIPACSACNSSVKHDKKFSLTKHIHPYFDKQVTQKYKLVSTYSSSLNKFKIDVDSSDKRIKTTLDVMKIKEIYETHQSELSDMEQLKKKYNKRYLADLGNLLGKPITEKDAYRILFGVEYEDENFYKRPLSKLKKDILQILLR